MSELHDIDRRMARIERIAKDTASGLERMTWDTTLVLNEVRGIRTELRDLRSDFCWLLGINIAGFVVTWALIAHGTP
jgi:hypothetical protein